MSKRKLAMSSENLSPQVLLRIQREIRELARDPPEGVKYVPDDEDSLVEILAEMTGPVGTPYEGGVFKMKLVLGGDFPNAPPKGYFLTKIYHPNISTTGEICVNTLKRDWSPDNTLKHVLQVIHCLLIVPFPESSLNDEAGKFFMESYDEYARRAKLMTSVHAAKAPSGGDLKASEAGDAPLGESSHLSGLASKGKALVEKQKAAKKKGLRRL